MRLSLLTKLFSRLSVCSSELVLTMTWTTKLRIPLRCSSGRTFHRVLIRRSMICSAMYLVCVFCDVSRMAGTRCQASGCSWNWARTVDACCCCRPQGQDVSGQHEPLAGGRGAERTQRSTHLRPASREEDLRDLVQERDIERLGKVEDGLFFRTSTSVWSAVWASAGRAGAC